MEKQFRVIDEIVCELAALQTGLDELKRRSMSELRDELSRKLNVVLNVMQAKLDQSSDMIALVQPKLDQLGDMIALVQPKLDQLDDMIASEIAARKESIGWIGSDLIDINERVKENRLHFDGEEAAREHLRLDLSALGEQVRSVAQTLETERNRISTAERRLGEAERRGMSTRQGLLSQEMRLSVLLECARKRLGEMDVGQLARFSQEDAHKTDALYLTFEDLFRGDREDIKERLRVYLPLLKSNGIGRTGMPVLDVGCGRGEWLELLRDAGLECQGVDINRNMLAWCLEHKLPVTEGDAITYLRGLDTESLGGITAFHIIEHLSFTDLIDLLDQTVRVLKPGGVAILETPNPANVLVSAERFYFDPTHRHPLPSPLMRFLAEQRGLCRIDVLELHPWPAAFRVPEDGSALAERFNQLFYGPQDYAIIGWKA
jgi:O-antigen chain-terminating methyltransferase